MMTTEYLTDIAGLSFRPAEIKRLVQELEVGDRLTLEADPDNPYDSNAVCIMQAYEFLGFVEKIVNPPIAERLAAGEIPTVVVKKTYPDEQEGKRPRPPLISIEFDV
jgi:hypothetical protein